MFLPDLISPVTMFVRAVQTGDRAALRATLCDEAVLIDDDQEFHSDSVSTWLEELLSKRTQTVSPINEFKRHGEVMLTILETVRNAKGGWTQVQRNWRFTMKADRILVIRMEPHTMPALPPAIEAYIRATNNLDLDGLLSTFVDDAIVNDQLQDYWGKSKIREWAAREIIGARLTMHVLNIVTHYGHIIVSARVDGDFDKRGLPNPLVASFYFSVPADRIVQLIVLRNLSGV
jgi:hypothetical protein